MDEKLLLKVRKVIAEQTGFPERKVTANSRIGWDLDVDGDDAEELINRLDQEFPIDMTKFPYDFYFGIEGGDLLGWLHDMIYDRKKLREIRKFRKKDFTVMDMVKSIEAGHWTGDIPYQGSKDE